MTPFLVVVAVVAVLAAAGFFLSSRSARAALRAQAGVVEGARAEAEAAAREGAQARAELKERRDELASLREQLRDAKKRAFEQQEAARKAGPVQALKEEVEKLGARLAEARTEAAAAAERAKGLEAQAERLGRDLERERVARRQAEEAPPPPPPAAAPAPAPAAGDDARARAEHERAEKAEAKLAEARKKIVELERDLKGARGRLETDRRVYMVQKGELDVAHDRHADLRRRYDALRKEHDELIDAVRQAAREDRRLAQDASQRSAAEPAGSEPKPAGAP